MDIYYVQNLDGSMVEVQQPPITLDNADLICDEHFNYIVSRRHASNYQLECSISR